MQVSYTDLTTYWQCPRRFHFSNEWEGLSGNEPVQVGILVHSALQASSRGEDWHEPLKRFVVTDDKATQVLKRATNLVSHYLKAYYNYVPLRAELEVVAQGATGHIDLVAMFDDQLALIDYKTTTRPDVARYDMSGQLDYYAELYTMQFDRVPDLIVYEVISEEGFYRHSRTPNLRMGQTMFNQATNLAVYLQAAGRAATLDDPHYSTACGMCPFLKPCQLMSQDGEEVAERYLEANYPRRAKNVGG
jgi:hypothetical protein